MTQGTDRIRVAWHSRAEGLDPLAVSARGECALRLAERLLHETDDRLAGLSGVAGPSLIVLLANEAELPWVDGVQYLGRDREAPSLLLPTTRVPNVPLALFERAVLRGCPGSPLAVGEDWSASVADARPIVRARLEAWLAAHRAGGVP